MEPPTLAIVRADAVGLSRMASSSGVKGSFGTRKTRIRTTNARTMGKPMAAMVWVIP
jgi:hypothetical protein